MVDKKLLREIINTKKLNWVDKNIQVSAYIVRTLTPF